MNLDYGGSSVSVEDISHPKMTNFRDDSIDEIRSGATEDEYGEDSDFASVPDTKARLISKSKPKKTKRTKYVRDIKDEELLKRPNYDIDTLERRFVKLKFNKLAGKIYNQDAAKDYRKLKSNLNLQLLEGNLYILLLL